MMNKEELHQYKKVYESIDIPDSIYFTGWDQLSNRLPEKQHVPKQHMWHRSIIFAGISVIFFVATIGAAQASKPGEILYPVKKLTNEIIQTVIQEDRKENEQKKGKTMLIAPSPTATHGIKPTLGKPTEKTTKNENKKLPGKSNGVLGTMNKNIKKTLHPTPTYTTKKEGKEKNKDQQEHNNNNGNKPQQNQSSQGKEHNQSEKK